MSVNIPNHFAQQYASNVELLLQQEESRLRPAVMQGSHKGEQASPVDQIGAVEMQEVVSRFSAMGRVDADVDRRWCLPSDFELPQLMDSFDKLRLITDPESLYVRNAVQAANRKIDELIIAAFFATALTGKTGSTSTTHTGGGGTQIDDAFGAAATSGLTVAKLREARRALMAADVDLDKEEVYCAIRAKQHDDLLAEAQVISTDYNDKPVLVEGKIKRFLGINFIHTELVDTDGTYRRVPVWVKSGMHLGVWNEIETSTSKRTDLSSEPYQAYVKMSMGATRLEEEKVVEIQCGE